MKTAFIFVLFTGLVIRLILVGNPGFEADISFWKSWSLAAIDHGIVWTAFNTNINYPPGFIYVLYLMGKLYSLLGDPHDYWTFWRVNNFSFLLASKSIAITADCVIAAMLYWFLKQKDKLVSLGVDQHLLTRNLPLIIATVFFLNPVVIIDSAVWGQVESLGLLFTLTAMLLLFYKRPLLATLIFAIGPQVKLQNIIFIPIFFIFVFRYYNLKTVIKSLAIFLTVFLLIILPFVIQGKTDQVLNLLTVNSDYFPWMSLNAHNLWWIVSKGAGMTTTDKVTVLGIMNAKKVGLYLFSAGYLIACLLTFLRPTARNFIMSLTFAIFSFFLLSTQSHERYSYPVAVLLLFLYPFLEKKFKKYFWILYSLFCLNIFFNIHAGLVINYPQNGLGFLTAVTNQTTTILNSYLSLILYLMMLPLVISQLSYLYILAAAAAFLLLIIASHLSYIAGGKMSLTSFKPIMIQQDYGSLQVNRSVNSFEGWKKWSRLSSSYFYYRKGFGTHANSNLVFDLNRKFSKLSTDYGIDTEAPTQATAVFQIYGDGKLLFESNKMGRFDFPQHIEVSISGIRYIGLKVTDAGDGINGDHADWFNPVLYK
ncbi:MAG: hypothetical protein UV73_C0005G0051 [Candidatus Gottesmanbacteria bacterium GW2011_GWA2_43_14]|uniref:Glycosyl hydrolase family 98 putative carbohydrate-binding module domain-containing protein n=1 Tax=Candidatus Gottesmanbacteria bacterium GW2011_GWA2_43_14 TaxID=1618443 RepID=A0A0G1DJF5_9BACT|nr:MAG: hypothetical protein UV73_C0005G0051 [Candidatus Gottesmanbacteria bacterium GW2011_GWA2_43_14]